MMDGYFTPVIHRNTTIPVSREESFQTMSPNQKEVLLQGYQGEGRRVEGQPEARELRITDIPPGPAAKRSSFGSPMI